MFSQSDDPEDVSVLIFPDWKVVHGVENSLEGAANLYENVLRAGIGRAGSRLQEDAVAGATRIRSWVLPYRAIILLCESSLSLQLDLFDMPGVIRVVHPPLLERSPERMV